MTLRGYSEELIDKATIKSSKRVYKTNVKCVRGYLNDRLPPHDQDQLYLNLEDTSTGACFITHGTWSRFSRILQTSRKFRAILFFSILSTRHIQIVHDVCLFRIDLPIALKRDLIHQDYPLICCHAMR